MKTIKLKINNVAGHVSGSEVTVKTDSHGVPLENKWRRRLKDAETDKCVEVVEPTKAKRNQETEV
jgi:hypothetical protein